MYFQQVNVLFCLSQFFFSLISLVSKSVFLTKFACANLAAKLLVVKLLNSEVVIYLSWSWPVTFFSISLTFVSYSVFLTKLLTSDISFSTAVNAEVVVNH